MENNMKGNAARKMAEKSGLISKSYKLNKTLVEDFAKACEAAGTTQAKQLSKMMKEFIEATNQY